MIKNGQQLLYLKSQKQNTDENQSHKTQQKMPDNVPLYHSDVEKVFKTLQAQL